MMNQEESDEEKNNGEKTELIPASVSDLRTALASSEEGTKTHFGRLPFMASHASLFHTVHFAVKSCQKIEKRDANIKKANQISRDVKRRVEKEEANSAKVSKEPQEAVKDPEPISTTVYQEPILAVEDPESLLEVEVQEPESTPESGPLLKVGSRLEALEPSSPMETKATGSGVELQEPDSVVGVQEPDLLVNTHGPVGEEPMSSELQWEEPDSAMETQATSLAVGEQEPNSAMETQATSLAVGEQEPNSAMETQATSLPVEEQEPNSATEAQATSLPVGVQEPDSTTEAETTSLPEEEQEPDSAEEAQPTGLPVGEQEPESATEAQPTSLPEEIQDPDSAMEAQVTSLPVEGQEPNSVVEAQATSLPVGGRGPDSAMETETTNVPARARETDSTVRVQKSCSVAEAKRPDPPVEEKATPSDEVAPRPSSARDSSRHLLPRVFHKTKSFLQLAKSKSVIFKPSQKDEVGELVPSDLFLYLALIESCLPLPAVTIQKLCLTGNILCRIQCFTLRRKKKERPPQPQRQPVQTTLHIPKLERIRDTDYVTFDSLKNLEWKLYKGLVKRKPKTTAAWKPPSFISGIRAVQPSKAVQYILPLIPKDWIIDDSLKYSGKIIPFLMEL